MFSCLAGNLAEYFQTQPSIEQIGYFLSTQWWDWQPVFLDLTDIPLWPAARPGSAKSQVWLRFPTSVYAHPALGEHREEGASHSGLLIS